ncbi:alkaline phosphatase family protein [Candidatus Latescibacterota bacterium]
MTMNRRTFLSQASRAAAGGAIISSCGHSRNVVRRKVIVLGIDGMDPVLTESFLTRGLMPNLQRIVNAGGFRHMTTTMPPQSPVAWSTVITGGPPRVHGIYDFIHRDPRDMLPYFSLSRISPPGRTLDIGGWTIPLERGETVQLRQGVPFWHFLEERDIPATLFKIPANFPVQPSRIDMVSGLGTPDLRGGYGNFTVFTTAPEQFPETMDGGRIIPVTVTGNTVRTQLPGPANTLKHDRPEIAIPVTIRRDSTNEVIRLEIGEHDLILKRGDWTGWLSVEFPALGSLHHVSGIVKIYVKSVHPDLIIYISPINIDPSDPALPIFSSGRYARELAEKAGLFYTQGMPEDTKALSNGVLSEDEYLALARQVFEERNRLLDIELDRFDRHETGLLFFYYSSLDQNSHVYWRLRDTKHPLYDTDLARRYGSFLDDLYTGIDRRIGRVLDRYDPADPENLILIMSDHGFTSFRRQVNLNTWLYENGLIALTTSDLDNPGYFTHVDWLNTEAYSVGINSIYLNLQGRERYGGLHASLADRRREAIRSALLELTDPVTGERAVSDVRIVPDDERRQQPHAPDLIVGWNTGFRTSWASVLGGFTPQVFSDNLDKWSGDHCMAPSHVPATLIANRPIASPSPELADISGAILSAFGLSLSGDEGRRPLLANL